MYFNIKSKAYKFIKYLKEYDWGMAIPAIWFFSTIIAMLLALL